MLNFYRRRTTPRGPQRGLSLVELMVGIAIGLVVVAGAALVASSQISDTRRLLLETQLQQDLRAAADIITRELRRAGSKAYGNLAVNGIWSPGSSAEANLYTTISPSTLPTTPGDTVGYAYYRTSSAVGGFGFRLNGGVIEFNLDGNPTTGWQALTDARVLRVTTFTVTQNNGPAVQLACAKECAGGGTACYPSWQTRELVVDIAGEAVADPTVQRSIRAAAKLRNDVLVPGASGPLCPP